MTIANDATLAKNTKDATRETKKGVTKMKNDNKANKCPTAQQAQQIANEDMNKMLESAGIQGGLEGISKYTDAISKQIQEREESVSQPNVEIVNVPVLGTTESFGNIYNNTLFDTNMNSQLIEGLETTFITTDESDKLKEKYKDHVPKNLCIHEYTKARFTDDGQRKIDNELETACNTHCETFFNDKIKYEVQNANSYRKNKVKTNIENTIKNLDKDKLKNIINKSFEGFSGINKFNIFSNKNTDTKNNKEGFSLLKKQTLIEGNTTFKVVNTNVDLYKQRFREELLNRLRKYDSLSGGSDSQIRENINRFKRQMNKNSSTNDRNINILKSKAEYYERETEYMKALNYYLFVLLVWFFIVYLIVFFGVSKHYKYPNYMKVHKNGLLLLLLVFTISFGIYYMYSTDLFVKVKPLRELIFDDRNMLLMDPDNNYSSQLRSNININPFNENDIFNRFVVSIKLFIGSIKTFLGYIFDFDYDVMDELKEEEKRQNTYSTDEINAQDDELFNKHHLCKSLSDTTYDDDDEKKKLLKKNKCDVLCNFDSNSDYNPANLDIDEINTICGNMKG